MSISEFTLHNVLRTYSRQERIGQVQRARPRGTAPATSGDQVSLSVAGRKIQWIGQLAAEVVSQRQPGLSADERSDLVRTTADALVARHRDEIGEDGLSAEAFESRLRATYLS
ncbi:MAG: hypothetical protein IH608_11280 [Proteobacteria bacterium]|nr:hypothetical protein [Pseudomonadota bacterium]